MLPESSGSLAQGETEDMKSETLENLKLGCVAKDTITGFEGVVIAITNWMNGCVRVTIQPKTLDNGKPIESHTFDVEQLEVVESTFRKAATQKGGPSIAPGQRKDPV